MVSVMQKNAVEVDTMRERTAQLITEAKVICDKWNQLDKQKLELVLSGAETLLELRANLARQDIRWLDWCEPNLHITDRTASNWFRVHKNKGKLESYATEQGRFLFDLTLTEALDFLKAKDRNIPRGKRKVSLPSPETALARAGNLPVAPEPERQRKPEPEPLTFANHCEVTFRLTGLLEADNLNELEAGLDGGAYRLQLPSAINIVDERGKVVGTIGTFSSSAVKLDK